MQPGARPLWELAGTLDHAGFGPRASLLQVFETDARSLVGTVRSPIVLIVDQFEELFTLADTDSRVRFGELISHAIRSPETPLKVIFTLRADYYDKPLSIPMLADLFVNSVVNVGPMTPRELERAVIEPARVAGVEVEPVLLDQLVADMSEEAGALPLLQVTLFELFELTEGELTLASYEKLGGLHGALAGSAEQLLSELEAEGRDLVEQLMIRMVHEGRAVRTARPVSLRELLDLDVDSVLLQRVLEAFAAQRLLTFDRDSSGVAVIEMAHEYLISEWPRMVEWIEIHSEDLDRIRALDAATAEWVHAERSPDYLIRGERLQGFYAWCQATTVWLTKTETEFIDASLELQRREQNQQQEREAKEESLARSARRRLWAFGTAVAVLAAAITVLVIVLVPDPPPDIIVFYDGRDSSYGDLVGAGIDSAIDEFEVTVAEMTQVASAPEIEKQVARGTGLVILDLAKLQQVPDAKDLASLYPGTSFVFLDCDALTDPELPTNVSCIGTRNEEVGFIAGAAAALASETGHVGFIGGVDIPTITAMRDGFEAGARYVDSSAQVESIYLTGHEGQFFDPAGFNSPTLARVGASYLFESGADVVFHAAGQSGPGLFHQAALSSQASSHKLWAIGVDVDEYHAVENDTWIIIWDTRDATVSLWKEHILTSAIKRLDIGVHEAIRQWKSTGAVGEVILEIANGGASYSTSGGHIDHLLPELDAAMQAVAVGVVEIEVDYEPPVVFVRDLFIGSEG
jgi:basic membrane lipoprotein Med (substrate-binding protein (PBP1-ABC) superfamily)